MISALFSRLIILTFGILYPAYASYKAVRTKNIKEYVKWMMYWIVFAFFTFFETFTDIFLSWFPFYYEVKIVIVFWLLSPATKGSSTLYRKFVHPMLTKREQEIDDYINQAKERGYSAVLQLGSKSVNYATNVIMQTAIKTIQYATNAEKGRTIVTSQSANAISDYMQNLEIEETNVARSSSLNALTITNVEFSEDDDQQFLNHHSRIAFREPSIVNSDSILDRGSARTRKTKTHKDSSGVVTRIGKRSIKAPILENSNVASGVRSRRKLRDNTPEIDVDIE